MLDTLGIAYSVRNIQDNDSNFNEVIDLGYQQVPVVTTPDQSWSGHDPHRIMSLKSNY